MRCGGTGRVPEAAARKVMVRYATASGWAVLPEWEREQGLIWTARDVCGKPVAAGRKALCNLTPPHTMNVASGPKIAPRQALKAAEAWLACPCEEHRIEWRNAWVRATGYDTAPMWLPYPPTCDIIPESQIPKPEHAVEAAARETDEPTIRKAIQDALVPWLLQ